LQSVSHVLILRSIAFMWRLSIVLIFHSNYYKRINRCIGTIVCILYVLDCSKEKFTTEKSHKAMEIIFLNRFTRINCGISYTNRIFSSTNYRQSTSSRQCYSIPSRNCEFCLENSSQNEGGTSRDHLDENGSSVIVFDLHLSNDLVCLPVTSRAIVSVLYFWHVLHKKTLILQIKEDIMICVAISLSFPRYQLLPYFADNIAKYLCIYYKLICNM